MVALMLWVAFQGSKEQMIWRLAVLGFLMDCADPASQSFHTLASIVLSGSFYLSSRYFHPRTFSGRFIIAACVSFTKEGLDCAVSGAAVSGVLVADVFITAIAAVGLCWLLDGIPESWRGRHAQTIRSGSAQAW